MGIKGQEAKTGRLASRVKQAQKIATCQDCGGVVEHVLFHDTLKKGRPALRCLTCKTIRLRNGEVVAHL